MAVDHARRAQGGGAQHAALALARTRALTLTLTLTLALTLTLTLTTDPDPNPNQEGIVHRDLKPENILFTSKAAEVSSH